MYNFLKKIKLIEELTTELEANKHDFVDRLMLTVDEADITGFSNMLDPFTSGKNEYKGHVDYHGFKIKRKRKFFDMQSSTATAEGSYIQKGSRLIINTRINGFSRLMIPFYIFVIVFYIIFFIAFLAVPSDNTMGLIVLPFILIHALFMLGIPYLMMRRSAKRMKYDLEREFFYLTQKGKSQST
jgi:hypothetical protein